jgi:transposase
MSTPEGHVEGTVNRVKQLKAAMYGRAKPDLLRKLILLGLRTALIRDVAPPR